MITHYDMASYEVFLDPETEAFQAPAVPGPVELRVQTLDEAVAIESKVSTRMPADLLRVNPAVFVDEQA